MTRLEDRQSKRVPASFDATKRSILRYLTRYEHDWGRRVSIRGWEMVGCTPPEEHPEMGVILTRGRVNAALGALVREGILERQRDPRGCRHYWLKESIHA